LIVPTFSYSYCWNKIYDKEKTASTTGILSELLRQDPCSFRSDDANFSVAAIGEKAQFLTTDMPVDSFGKNSFWERLLKVNGKICCLNVGIVYNTFVHFVEKLLEVPYRFDKKFSGKSLVNGKIVSGEYVHFARDLDNPNTYPDLTKFSDLAKKLGYVREAVLGKGQVSSISVKDTLEIIKKEIKKDPNFLIKGHYV